MAGSITLELSRNIPLYAALAKSQNFAALIPSEGKDSELQQTFNEKNFSAGQTRTVPQLQLQTVRI